MGKFVAFCWFRCCLSVIKSLMRLRSTRRKGNICYLCAYVRYFIYVKRRHDMSPWCLYSNIYLLSTWWMIVHSKLYCIHKSNWKFCWHQPDTFVLWLIHKCVWAWAYVPACARIKYANCIRVCSSLSFITITVMCCILFYYCCCILVNDIKELLCLQINAIIEL